MALRSLGKVNQQVLANLSLHHALYTGLGSLRRCPTGKHQCSISFIEEGEGEENYLFPAYVPLEGSELVVT